MEFRHHTAITSLLVPPGFEEEHQEIEFREDPLTGTSCRINTRRTRRPGQAQRVIETGYNSATPPDCTFCPRNIERLTPQFPPELFREGRIRQGECYLFPNLFPLAEYHTVATLSPEHFLGLNQFTTEMIVDNLLATIKYLSVIQSHDNGRRLYPVYLWNHLPPSAASIVHPHTQILIDRNPTTYQRQLLECSQDYFRRTGKNFWQELAGEEEKRGERFIASLGSVSVMASYAPQGNREVLFLFHQVSNLAGLSKNQIADLAACVIGALHGYSEMGINSFNLSTFSGPLGEDLEYYSLHAKLISRPLYQPFYRNDTGALERLHYESDIEMEPEVVAQELRAFLREHNTHANET